ncbi:CSS-motif domain-containing protein [Pseudomonas rubra]|uniref:CSS-motif domain-containing protein n=1 Tax=Pseudomonas rubra TaxID=2942627 RepID=A0ABT5PB33_9PSED|nr:CSS-motif domain-containing protein [Pseudomonas rubra]MDD1015154.1 CSS-motif domain-containing protein [Pseudomonas rubra]MDD1037733.1 CSS-motif domain-containing protein [Pseudomonas rubra]MDD1157347.1 CSS-motif domain-containing protein [Pseudomonas rubra]
MALSRLAGRSLLEFLITLLIGLAPVACGLLVLALQVERKQEETAAVSAAEAIYAIDLVIDTLHSTSNAVLGLAGQRCEQVLPALRQAALRQPSVRSLILIRDNRGYCGTVLGNFDAAFDPGSYFNQRLRLDLQNQITPDMPVLHYRLQEHPVGVIATSDARTLQLELQGFQNGIVLALQFGSDFLWANGSGSVAQVPNYEEDKQRQVSDKYGYVVHAGYPDGHTRQVLRQAIHSTAPLLLLVGILTSAVAYWSLFRQQRQPAP